MSSTPQQHLTAVGIYTVIMLMLCAPVLPQVTHAVIGSGGDPWQTLWRFENTAREVTTHWQAGTITRYLGQELLGGGEPRLVNLTVWPYLPLHFLLGQPLTYNLVWLLSFVGSGYTMYLLVRHLTHEYRAEEWRTHAAALLAGLYYMLLPYHVAHSQGHFGAMQLLWLPLLIFTFLRLLDRPSLTRGAAFIAAMTVQAWSEHHYAFWFALFAVLYVFWHRRKLKPIFTSQNIDVGLLTFLLFVALVIVPYAPTIRLSLAQNSALALGEEQTSRFSADLLAYVTPSPWHPWWGEVAASLFSNNFTGNVSESTHFLGLVPLLLVLFMHQAIPREQKKWWVLTAGVFAVISLGPWLHILGYATSIPLPYALLDALPVFSAVRTVARASSLVGIALAVLLGWVLVTQARRKTSYVLVGVLIGLEFLFLPPRPQAVAISSVYQAVATLPGSAIIELPAPTNYTLSSRALYASLTHGKKVIGNIALERGESGEEQVYLRTLPGLRQVLFLRSTQLIPSTPDFANQSLPESFTDAVRLLDIGGVVVHPDSLSAPQSQALKVFFEQHLGLKPEVYEDTILYRLSPRPTSDGVLIGREAGWANVGFDPAKNVTVASIPDAAQLLVINDNERDVSLTIDAEVANGSHGHLVATLDQAAPPTTVQAGSGEKLTFSLRLTPGQHHLRLRNQLPDRIILHNLTGTVTPTRP